MHIDISVGQKIKLQREDKKITQHELARLLEMTPAAVCQWETRGTVPRVKTLAKIAQALGVPEDYFTGESDALRAVKIRDSVSAHMERLKAKVAEATGVDASRVCVNITIADGVPPKAAIG